MENFFSTNLKYLRTQANLTQLDVAEKINKDYSTIGKWELNQRNPSVYDLFKLADLFGVQMVDMVLKDLRYKDETIKYSTIADVKESIKSLSEKDMNRQSKESLINMVDTLHNLSKNNKGGGL